MRILVTGISGFVGSQLAPRLVADGHEVRGLARRPEASPPGVDLAQADVVSGEGLTPALDGIEVAYYLIHSMEPSRNGAFQAREHRAAHNFVGAARRAGVRRIIYLGGIVPAAGRASPHLASRLAVEEVLLGATDESVAFRASIVIGARSRSFRFLVRLVERLPVLIVPAWRNHRTAPIDQRDVIEFLARAADAAQVAGRSLDLAGPDEVTYAELIDLIREAMLLDRPTVGLSRVTATPIASRISSVIAGEDWELIGPLMEGLQYDLLPRNSDASQLLGVRPHALSRAINRALREWEETEPLKAR
ncbi:MAG TPA: NAD-dependent epimerase/dehydratase family protein [Solirubrobacteraceae bacterium]|nr:NAD-dependent epimerase/dehydratase family protein [Solirubrobacteraceae bacterium]